MNRPVAISRTCALSIDGCALKSNPARVAHEREAGQSETLVDPALVTPGDLALAKQRQCVADRQVVPARFIDQAVKLIAQGSQLETVQHGNQVIVVGHQKPPPIAASYSASGRSKADDASAAIASGSARIRVPSRARTAQPRSQLLRARAASLRFSGWANARTSASRSVWSAIAMEASTTSNS